MREGSGQGAVRVPQVDTPVPVRGGKRITIQSERHREDSPASPNSKRRGQDGTGRDGTDGTAGEQAGGPDPVRINWPPFVVALTLKGRSAPGASAMASILAPARAAQAGGGSAI